MQDFSRFDAETVAVERLRLYARAILPDHYVDGVDFKAEIDHICHNMSMSISMSMYGRKISEELVSNAERVPISWFDHCKLDLISILNRVFGTSIDNTKWVRFRNSLGECKKSVHYHCIPYDTNGKERLYIQRFTTEWDKPFIGTRKQYELLVDIQRAVNDELNKPLERRSWDKIAHLSHMHLLQSLDDKALE